MIRCEGSGSFKAFSSFISHYDRSIIQWEETINWAVEFLFKEGWFWWKISMFCNEVAFHNFSWTVCIICRWKWMCYNFRIQHLKFFHKCWNVNKSNSGYKHKVWFFSAENHLTVYFFKLIFQNSLYWIEIECSKCECSVFLI